MFGESVQYFYGIKPVYRFENRGFPRTGGICGKKQIIFLHLTVCFVCDQTKDFTLFARRPPKTNKMVVNFQTFRMQNRFEWRYTVNLRYTHKHVERRYLIICKKKKKSKQRDVIYTFMYITHITGNRTFRLSTCINIRVCVCILGRRF